MAQKKTILVVDDNPVNRKILCRILQADGYQTSEAENGQTALELLRREDSAVSLVLLDIAMPVMNGYELLDEMTASGIIARVPVIMTTGADDEQAEAECLERGASDFLKKPYNVEMVRHRVQSLLRLWDNAALISRLEIDSLTNVYSKEFFYQHAEKVLNDNPDDLCSIIYTDIDDFKLINARFGTSVGDELLKYLGVCFKRMAGEDGVCGHFSGDIFVMLLRNYRQRTQAEIEQLFSEIYKYAPVRSFQLKFGIYPVQDRTITISEMCDRAKMAIATVKHQYGMHCAVYDESMLTRALREHQLADCMETALEHRQFQVYLQPKHSTETREVAGAEALVRWQHPELGFISAGEFIPLFERNGFITKLDGYMLAEVCRLIKGWISEGITPVPISVNVSRSDFALEGLPERISNQVDAYDIPHSLIHLEVTESAYTDNPQQIINDVSALQDMGFLIEMDDFGSGYSSLNMLSELPIDILKLDMKFMQSGNDRAKGDKKNILSFIVSLSKWMQLPTIAEGVETQEEFEQLRAMGCNYIQGYYFSRPMPAGSFIEYMKAHPAESKAVEISVPSELRALDAGEPDNDKRLLLVVEDIDSNRELLTTLLKPYYNVAEAANGKEACEYLMAHHSEVSCILLDLLMPVMDGFQVLEFMRSNGMINEVPVIITTETGSNSELRALHLGASSFVGKPYNPEILFHHIRKAVEEKEFWAFRGDFERQKYALCKKAYMDELTGLLNRHGLKDAVTRLSTDEKYTAIMLDIDNLKQINDTRGHASGDDVIRMVAETLKSGTRAGDILARIGGDEFMILLRGMSDADSAHSKGQRLCSELCRSVQFSCSAGAALASQSESFTDVFRRADTALYKAKRESKGECVLWNTEKAAVKPVKEGASV